MVDQLAVGGGVTTKLATTTTTTTGATISQQVFLCYIFSAVSGRFKISLQINGTSITSNTIDFIYIQQTNLRFVSNQMDIYTRNSQTIVAVGDTVPDASRVYCKFDSVDYTLATPTDATNTTFSCMVPTLGRPTSRLLQLIYNWTNEIQISSNSISFLFTGISNITLSSRIGVGRIGL